MIEGRVVASRKPKFHINQRVIYKDEICMVQRGRTMSSVPPKDEPRDGYVWVFVPSKGYALSVDERNVKPLPGGHL